MNRNNRIGIAAAIIGNGIFGFSFMFSRIALGAASPFVMLMYRFIIAFAMINLLALWSARRGVGKDSRGEVHWLRFDLRGRRLMPLLLMGLIQPVGYFLCESYGISLTNSTLAGVIIATLPIFGLAAAAIFLKEYPRRLQILFSLISIMGVVLMTLQQRSDGEIRIAGVFLLLGAVLAGAAFNIISRSLSGEFSALERTYIMMGVAALCFTLLALLECRSNPAALIAPAGDPAFMGCMLYLGVASSIVAFMALNVANGCLPIAKSISFCNLTTVISLFAGVIFLHEPFSAGSLLASVLIILGIWGVQRVH